MQSLRRDVKSACPDEDSTVMMTAHYDCDCRRWIWGRLPEAPKLDLAICYDFANSSGAPSRRWRCAGRTGYARKSRDGWRRVCYPLWRPRGANPCRTQDQDPHPSDWGHGRCAAQRRQARPLLAGTLAAAGPLCILLSDLSFTFAADGLTCNRNESHCRGALRTVASHIDPRLRPAPVRPERQFH